MKGWILEWKIAGYNTQIDRYLKRIIAQLYEDIKENSII